MQKKKDWFWFYLSLFWIIFFLLQSLESSAAPAPVVIPAGQSVYEPYPIQTYNQPTFTGLTATGSYRTVSVGSPQLVQPSQTFWSGWVAPQVVHQSGDAIVRYSPPATATNTNPAGYIADVSGGQPRLIANVPATVVPPTGSTAAATAAAATAAAGTTAGVLTKVVPLGTGAGSLAATLGKGLLLAPVAVLTSPWVAAAMTGYGIYSLLEANGVFRDSATGVFMTGGVPVKVYRAAVHNWVSAPSAAEVCTVLMAYYPGSVSFAVVGVTATQFSCQMYKSDGSGNGGQSGTISTSASPVTVASPSDLSTVVDTVVANPSNAAALSNAYLKSGLPLYDDATLGAETPGQSLFSPFSEVRNQVDSVGNVTSDVARHRVQIPAGKLDGSQMPEVFLENKTIVNNQATTNTMFLPLPLVNPLSKLDQQQQADLCVQHPEILACADITVTGDVPDSVLLKKDINVSLTPVQLSGLAVCPAPVVIPGITGVRVISFDVICQFGGYLKPLILAFSWLSAGGIVFVGRPYATT